MKNIEHLCRICVKESHFFKHIYNKSVSDDYIFKIINELCDLNIRRSDGLPEYICGECYGKLLEIQKFKKMCHDGTTALLTLKTKYSHEVGVEARPHPRDPLGGEADRRLSGDGEMVDVDGTEVDEREASEDLTKRIAMNEIFIKMEPADDEGEVQPSGMGDAEEVIIPEAHGMDVTKIVPDRCGTGGLPGPPQPLRGPPGSFPIVSGTGAGHHDSQGGRHNRHDITESAVPKGSVDTKQHHEKPSEVSLPSFNIRVLGPEDLQGKGIAVADRMSRDVDRKEGKVKISVAAESAHVNDSKASVKLKQKAVLISDPGGQGNVVLQKMAPNKFLPIMVTKQPLILLHASPSNPGVLQASYLNSKRGGGGFLAPPTAAAPVAPPVVPAEDRGVKGSESAVDGDMGVSYLCMTVPSDHRPYMCETCGKCFRRGLHLRYHRSTHRDERPFSCSTCGKSFKLKTILTTHMMTHSREPPRFACDLCDKRFPTRARLKYHQVVHSSERNFECRECRKRFKTKHQLSVHARTHLSRDDALFPCPGCEHKFKQLIGLRKHRARLNH